MFRHDGKSSRRHLGGVVAAALLLAGWHAAQKLPEPELHMRLEVAVLVGGTGFAVALIR